MSASVALRIVILIIIVEIWFNVIRRQIYAFIFELCKAFAINLTTMPHFFAIAKQIVGNV